MSSFFGKMIFEGNLIGVFESLLTEEVVIFADFALVSSSVGAAAPGVADAWVVEAAGAGSALFCVYKLLRNSIIDFLTFAVALS